MVSAGFIILLILVAIFAPLIVKLLGAPGPERPEPERARRFRDADGSELAHTRSASIRSAAT